MTLTTKASSRVPNKLRCVGIAATACVAMAAASPANAGAGLVPHKAISLPAGVCELRH